MKCYDCQFRKNCSEVKDDLISFTFCSKRMELLFKIELENKLNKIKQLDKLKERYGFDFPMKAKYKRSPTRIYTIMDFDDGEEIEFYGMCEKPSSCAFGYAEYVSEDKGIRLIEIGEIEAVL